MLPADERLDTDDRATGEVDDRLVLEEELLLLDGAPEVGLELEPLHRLELHPGLEQLAPVLAATLGEVHRDVGVADDLIRLPTVVLDGDSDARRDECLPPADGERLSQSGGDPRRQHGPPRRHR